MSSDLYRTHFFNNARNRNRTGTGFNSRRILSPVRLPIPPLELKVGEEGFEPSKAMLTDLQSAPFDRSGTLPHLTFSVYHTNFIKSSKK